MIAQVNIGRPLSLSMKRVVLKRELELVGWTFNRTLVVFSCVSSLKSDLWSFHLQAFRRRQTFDYLTPNTRLGSSNQKGNQQFSNTRLDGWQNVLHVWIHAFIMISYGTIGNLWGDSVPVIRWMLWAKSGFYNSPDEVGSLWSSGRELVYPTGGPWFESR